MDVVVNVKLGKKHSEIKITELDQEAIYADGEITISVDQATDLHAKLQDAIAVVKRFTE